MRRKLLSAIAFVLAVCGGSAYAVVCREASVAGYEERMAAVSEWIGQNTSDLGNIRLFVSKGSGEDRDHYYIHSNFVSENPDIPGARSEYATKIVDKADGLPDLPTALGNVIFWPKAGEGPPHNWHDLAADALKNAEIFVDPELMGVDGRTPFDMSTARSIQLARDSGPITTERIETLRLDKPPPALIERMNLCCLSGRPAGRGAAIARSLERLSFNPKDVGLLSMVVDSATAQRIQGSPTLSGASARGESGFNTDWPGQIAASLQANRGRSLVILTHVSKGEVVVEDAGGAALYRVKMDDLHQMAKDHDVNLVLLGCDTAAQAATHPNIGVIGRYNTEHAAARLEMALSSSKNPLEFLQNLSSEGLMVVTQEGAWSPNGIGATYYSKPDGPLKRARRAFRIWFFGERDG